MTETDDDTTDTTDDTEFPDWAEVARNPLVLPIHGKRYTIPALGHLDGIRIREAQAAARKLVDGEKPAKKPKKVKPLSDEQFFRMVLGDALMKMRKDNVPDEAIAHAAMVAHAAATIGREKALYIWQRGLDPKALAQDLAMVTEALRMAEAAENEDSAATPA